jgi:hypothetical protein
LRENSNKKGGWNGADFRFVGVHQHQDIKSAVQELGLKGVKAVVNELKQLLNKKVFEAVMFSDVPKKSNGKADCISSRTFLKEKSTDLAKARLVAGGHLQNKNIYSILEELYSPTVKGESTNLLLAIAVAKKMKIVTMDIVGAYLNASMDRQVYMVINVYESEILCELDSTLRKFVHSDGKLYVVLKKALYGCVESAKLFFNHMRNNLLQYGFVQSKYDECVFTFTDNDNNRCLIGCHVDDLLIACGNDKLMNNVIAYLHKQYNDVKVTRGNVHKYLGMQLTVFDNFIELDMNDYCKKVLAEYGIRGSATSPGTVDLFKDDTETKLLNDKDKERFHTFVAKLLFVARKVRLDLLTVVSYLTTRVQRPNVNDKVKLERLLKYLNSTLDYTYLIGGKIFNDDGTISVNCYIDSSHGVHEDFRGQTGIVIKLGEATVYARSAKQKMNTKSSAETELMGVSEEVSQAIWTRWWLEDFGFDVKDINLFQDNKSTIIMMLAGKPSGRNARHINIRKFFIKDYIDENVINPIYKNTNELFVDTLTKPIQGFKLNEFSKKLLTW